MECSEPGAIRDEELMAYLDGVPVRPLVAAHIARCPHCSQQVGHYRQLEQQLTGKLYRWDCPSSQVLGEYHLGMLGSEEGTRIRQHLSSCVLCAAELATLSDFLAQNPVLELPSVAPQVSPAPAMHNHHHVGQVLEHLQERALSGVRTLVAALLPAQPQLVFQRDAAAQPSSWPRRYAAEDVLISLQLERAAVSRASVQVQLLGLVTRSGAALATVQGAPVLLREQRPGADSDRGQHAVYTQHVDELGNFLFSALVPATYTLELHFPQEVIVIDQLVLVLQD